MTTEIEEIKCTVITMSDSAVLVDHDGDEKNYQWIPYSVLVAADISRFEVGETYDIDIPVWIAREKGMI